MTDKGELRAPLSSGVSTFLHTELGEAIKQTTLSREIYLGEARVYGLRNKEYLLENLEGVNVGDRVTLYRKYNNEPSSCTGITSWAHPDDGASIRVITLDGRVLGYIQPMERYFMAELMKAGKHLYAKIRTLNTAEPIDTQRVITLDVYLVEESKPLFTANTFQVSTPKYEPMETNGNAIEFDFYQIGNGFHYPPEAKELVKKIKVGDRLRLIRKSKEGAEFNIEVWTEDKLVYLGDMFQADGGMLAHIMDTGKRVYAEVTSLNGKELFYSYQVRFSVFAEV